MLLEWRNNVSTREACHNTDFISMDEHVQWLKKTLSNENRKLYIAEIDGAPVGTVRADYENPGYELSWTVCPRRRGLSVGKRMVRQLANTIPESIRAEIKASNFASIRIAEEAGMEFERAEMGILHYRRGAVAAPII